MPERDEAGLAELYQELILDHYRRPRNKGSLEAHTRRVALTNPTCGDELELDLLLDGDTIADVRFSGRGCSISQASASMMTQLIKGKTVAEARALAARFGEMMHGSDEAARDRALGEARALAGVAKFPVRVKCALLGWNALEESAKASS
ncbi:MAG TPA: SUF system NifU family Fe-S cluster assembly protein [Gemmatimonadales bacterium]|nr:SUF system NifU family Fe-S cluster assembly protein [Gemmatimonadales bacterium]